MSNEPVLIVEQFGAYVGKHSERLRVSKDKETLAEAPLMHLEQVLVSGRGVSLSTDAIAACGRAGIPIHLIDGRGRPLASFYAAGLTGTVQTRRAQLLAYTDRRGVTLALAFASGKIANQASLLKYMAKYRKATAPELYRELRRRADEVRQHIEELQQLDAAAPQGATIDEVRFQLLSVEGRAAQLYWAAIKEIVPPELNWPGRRTRGAKDSLNSALNYGYGILYGQIERALVLAGLDPYAGFIHADRPGKPSLTLDAIEEFRQPVVDRTVLGLANKGFELKQDEEHMLAEDTRRALAEKILERLEESTERYEGKKQALRIIIQSQARHLATFLRGDRAEYVAFTSTW
jgi:CRISPR-associated protein Cas1